MIVKFPNSANDRTTVKDNELPKLLRVAMHCKNHEMQSSSQAWLWRYQRQIKRQWCSKTCEFRSSKKMMNRRVQLSTEKDVPNWATKFPQRCANTKHFRFGSSVHTQHKEGNVVAILLQRYTGSYPIQQGILLFSFLHSVALVCAFRVLLH